MATLEELKIAAKSATERWAHARGKMVVLKCAVKAHQGEYCHARDEYEAANQTYEKAFGLTRKGA